MLDERLIEKLIERLVNRIEEANTYVLKQIGESIMNIGTLSPSKTQQLEQILKYGANYDKIVEKLAKITDLNVQDIYEIFEEVAKSDYAFAKQFYDYRNMKYIPFEENTALQRQVRALANITANEYINLSNTLAFATRNEQGKIIYTELSRMYQKILDTAILSISQGKTTFDSEMYRIIKELATSGIRTVDYASGRSMRLDSAVRMNMSGALRNLHNETQKIIGEEFGADGVEISVHINPAPDHAEVQGRQFSKKEFEKFQNDQTAIDYTGKIFPPDHDGHDRRSISQYNCYHYTFNIVLGVSKPNYSEDELKELINNNNKGFELDGEHYTNYEGTQLQRKLETEIRKQKDIQIMAKTSGNKELVEESQQKITQLTYKYKELSNVSGLPTKMERMRVSGYRRINVNNINNINPINKLHNYQQQIDTKGIESLDYNQMFNDYTNFYNGLDKQEIKSVLNKMDTYNKRDNAYIKSSNPMGEFINEKLGYDVKPELISEKEFMIDEFGEPTNDYMFLDENHVYRGIKDKTLEMTKKDIQDFKTGKFYAGSGIEGNGTYTTRSFWTASQYAYNQDEGFIIKMVIRKNAKKITFDNINEIKRNMVKYGKNISDPIFKDFSQYILTDNGYLASLLGYDVIEGQNLVILNRGSVKVVK